MGFAPLVLEGKWELKAGWCELVDGGTSQICGFPLGFPPKLTLKRV